MDESAQFHPDCSECRKWYHRTCGVFALVCIVVFAGCMYGARILNDIQELKLECKLKMMENTLEQTGEEIVGDILYRDKKGIRQILEADSEAGIQNHQMSRNKRSAGTKSRSSKMMIGHYVQKKIEPGINNDSSYQHSHIIKTCHHVDELKGTLCSRTNVFNSDQKALQIFKLSPKLSATQSPLKTSKKKPGKFIAKKRGIYLVYTQVTFYDNKEHQKLTVKHWSKKGNKVLDEYSCIRGGLEFRANNTCSITTVFIMGRGDYLTVEVFETELTLNVLNNNAFFGAIFLR